VDNGRRIHSPRRASRCGRSWSRSAPGAWPTATASHGCGFAPSCSATGPRSGGGEDGRAARDPPRCATSRPRRPAAKRTGACRLRGGGERRHPQPARRRPNLTLPRARHPSTMAPHPASVAQPTAAQAAAGSSSRGILPTWRRGPPLPVSTWPHTWARARGAPGVAIHCSGFDLRR
jgi:hypothetical protein